MSDEQDPPAFSLRPRKKPAEDETAAEAKDTQDQKPKLSLKSKKTEGATEAPKLSLKPKSAEPAPDAPAPAEPAAEPTKPRAKPKLSIKLGDDAKKEPAPAETPALAPEAEKPAEPAPEAKPRVKPKLSLGTDTATKEPAAEKPAETPPPAPAPKPPPAIAPEPAAPESDLAAEEAPVVEHRDETNPAVDPAVQEALKKAKAEKPKLKLNISKTADNPEQAEKPAAAAPDLPPPPGKGSANLPPPVPVVTDDKGKSATAPPMPLPAEEDIDDDDDDDSEAPVRKRMRPEQRPIFKIAVIVIGIVLLGAIGAGGYMVYNMMFGGPDEFETPTTPVATTPEESAPVDLTGASSLAGKMIEKAQNAANAIGETTEAVKEAAGSFGEDENEADDALTDAEALVDSSDVDSPRAIIDANPEPVTPTAVQPSQAFQAWVSGAVISGVREGSEPRAFINSLLVKRGDSVDAQLGITFDSVDAVRNLVIFKDHTGAIVGKRY